MHRISQFFSKPEHRCALSLAPLPVNVPDNPFKPLEFWHIAPHDRKTLVERITPYMVTRLPEKYLMQTIAADYRWSCAILTPKSEQTEHHGISCWQQVVTEFWDNPSRTTEKLLILSQAWFYTLLRYTYRMRFSARGKTCRSNLSLAHTNPCPEAQHASQLTKREIHRLTGIPNKYGATFYRSCFKDVQRCSTWKSFCACILYFCKAIQFPTYSDSAEEILKELGTNLPSVILQRRWFHTAARLAEASHLATSTADYVKKLDAKATSEGLSSLKRMEKLEKDIINLHAQCKTLSLASERMATCQRSLAVLTERMATGCMDSGSTQTLNHTSSSLEELVACRWLLENLPVAIGVQKGFSMRWRRFWQLQWDRYDDSPKSAKHPLRQLKCDEKHNWVGLNLYGTLSNVLHGYGHLRNIPLHPDVQRLVKTIGPVHYSKDMKIDIEAERRRWSPERIKVVSKKHML